VAVFALAWVGLTLAKEPRKVRIADRPPWARSAWHHPPAREPCDKQFADRTPSVRSADGRWLASVRFERTNQGEQKHVISLSDARTGKVVRQWEREAYKVIVIKFVGFSPDGRLLLRGFS